MPKVTSVAHMGRRVGLALAGMLLATTCFAREAPGIAQRREALLGNSGAFLAAMSAQTARDMRAAADYYRDLLQGDPRNPALVERAFIAELSDGDYVEAFKFAEKMSARDGSNPLAQAALGIRAISQKKYQNARELLGRASGGRGRNSDLTVALLTAWTRVGSNQLDRALEVVDGFSAPELAAYRNFFGGLMAEVAGNQKEAQKRLEVAYRTEPGTLRVADAYARNISRNGRIDDAIKVYGEWESRNSGQPLVRDQLAELRAGRPLKPLATTVQQGAAEVLYGLGAASNSGREQADTSLIFMQLAQYLNPDDDLIKISVAELFEQMKQWQRAGEAYGKIANASPYRIRSLLGRVVAYERQEKTDDAIRTLTTLLQESPGELDAVDMLGGLYRQKKKLQESIDTYSAAISRLDKPERSHWNLYFGRGVSYERNKQWAKGEPDFLKALELLPVSVRSTREKYERAQVLNYLAYSWVDQGLNIDRSFAMLKEAVSLAPEDGAIVDSLGWAYYRLAKYEDAVRELERAVELKPGDPTINDHLGDAYWKVGRKDEARFKWNQARDLKPEAEDLLKITKKLDSGLQDELPPIPAELKTDIDAPPPPPTAGSLGVAPAVEKAPDAPKSDAPNADAPKPNGN